MRKPFTIAAIVAALCSATAVAQVGRSVDACVRQWGRPMGGAVATNGAGVLRFSREGLEIELEFAGGRALRASYKGVSLGGGRAETLLSLNSDGAAWLPWAPSGVRGASTGGRWMRQDDLATAALQPDRLLVWCAAEDGDGVAPATVPGTQAAPEAAPAQPPDPAAAAVPTPPETGTTVRGPVDPLAGVDLPSRGESRDRALERLGTPLGSMDAGGREVLLYEWGQVWVVSGLVWKVEEQVRVANPGASR